MIDMPERSRRFLVTSVYSGDHRTERTGASLRFRTGSPPFRSVNQSPFLTVTEK